MKNLIHYFYLKRTLLFIVLGLAFNSFSQNLVVNGDFSAGNIGFTTTDIYCNTNGCLNPYFNNAYAIGPNATFFHPLFVGTDHTTGSGNFMIVNGGLLNDIVWNQVVPVSPNTTYSFSAWACSVFTANIAPLGFYINGVSVGTISAPSSFNFWTQFSSAWNSGANSSATLTIRCINTSVSAGNWGVDFGIDDISFKRWMVSSFLTNTLSLCAGQAFTFTNTSVSSTNYSWNFGDGSVSTQTNVSHTYTNSGTYTVQLSAFNGTNVAFSTTTVTVKPLPIVTIATYSQSSGTNLTSTSNSVAVCVGTNLQLLANASAATSPYTYFWTGGPATSSRVVTQSSAGTTTFVVNVSAMNGCSNTASVQATFMSGPTITVQNATVCAKNSVMLVANGASTYTWIPGAITGSTIFSTPSATQSYTINGQLSNGCGSTSTCSVLVSKCSSVHEAIANSIPINIYPIPLVDELFIENGEVCEIILTTASGEFILQQVLDQGVNKINLAHCPGGFYILKISCNGNTLIKKILKTN